MSALASSRARRGFGTGSVLGRCFPYFAKHGDRRVHRLDHRDYTTTFTARTLKLPFAQATNSSTGRCATNIRFVR